MRRDTKNDRGAALVEFALVLPILLLLVVGIIEFGRAYNTQVALQAGVREGARELALRHDGWEQAVRDATPSVDIDSISGTGCPDDDVGQATVTASEAFTFLLPFLDLGTITLDATGAMRCGL